MQRNHTTGLDDIQFDDLAAMIGERLVWDAPIGRPKSLTLEQAVKATLIYFKNNVTEDVIAELMFVDQTTISRTIARIEAVITDVLADWVPTLDEALHGTTAVVDGSLLPCWSWRSRPELRSGKHHTTGHNHQFVSTLGGRPAGPRLRSAARLPPRQQRRRKVRRPRHPRPGQHPRRQGLPRHRDHRPIPQAARRQTPQRTGHPQQGNQLPPVRHRKGHRQLQDLASSTHRLPAPLSTYPTAFSAIRALYFYSMSSA